MVKPPVVLPLPGLSLAKGLDTKLLPSALSTETHQPASQARADYPQPLWLALVFPQLALETRFGQQADLASVLVREYKGRSVVHSVSTLAQAQGIKIDMPVNAAYALSPGLKVYPYDEHAENNRLQQLAVWAEQFTSRVSIQTPRALLLEVRGSLKLFGGLGEIQQHMARQLDNQWQHNFVSAITPTPMASLLLARSGYSDVILRKNALRSVLGRLSVNHLPIGLKKKQQLRRTGVRLLRDVFRLPKDALARRFGAKLTNYLDRALGLIPEPLDFFTSSEAFKTYYEFPLEIHKTDLVLNVAEQLLEQLALFLRERDICINQCEFRLHHDKQSATTVIVGVRQASRDPQHLLTLLREQLERLALKASIQGITLEAHDFLPFIPQDASLFSLLPDVPLDQPQPTQQTNIDHLLEQLQARLGRDAIKKIYSVNDHRPEYAYCFHDTGKKQNNTLNQQRPFWLLPEPQLLSQKDNRPWLNGPVSLLKGPERIEAGWWSGHDVRRDYYIAIDNRGSHLWVFQEHKQPLPKQPLLKQPLLKQPLLKQHQWYLHGIFA
jgi:protein ImuB